MIRVTTGLHSFHEHPQVGAPILQERGRREQHLGRGRVSAQDLAFLTHQPAEWPWLPMCPWSWRGLSSLTLC